MVVAVVMLECEGGGCGGLGVAVAKRRDDECWQ